MLFAYLVLNRERPVGRGELVDAIWPAGRHGNGAALLRPVLSRLRRALGEGVIDGRAQLELVLPPDAWIDVEAAREAIERAQVAAAAGNWTDAWGPAQVALSIAARGLLVGLEAPWIETRRVELDDMRLEALSCVARTALGLGGSELGAAERAARGLIERAPFRETGYRLLMEAYEAQGNVAEALLVYELLRNLLREELGTAPQADVGALHQRLLERGGRTRPA